MFVSIAAVAIKRCYENARRNFKEQQDGMENYVEAQSKKRRYRAHRQRVGLVGFFHSDCTNYMHVHLNCV